MALTTWAGSLAIVLLAARYGPNLLLGPHEADRELLDRMCVWDGQWYARILSSGYESHEKVESSIAFFPAYPLVARGLSFLLRVSPNAALLIVSHAFLIGTFVTFALYLRLSHPSMEGSITLFSLLAMALFPTSFYWRMAYTESMLLFLMLLAMLGMCRRWPGPIIALIIGLATATRSVGIALILPFFLHLWVTSRREMTHDSRCQWRSPDDRSVRKTFLARTALLGPLACWGLLAFIGYQFVAFGEPFAFIKAQGAWFLRETPESIGRRVVDLLTLEPIFAVYTPDSPCYWKRFPPGNALMSLVFANPLFFVGTTLLIVLGAWKRWLSPPEWTLSFSLLLIPYILQTGRMCMASQARFASIAFPAYVVLGQLLARIPIAIAVYLLLCGALLMSTYTALFTSWYPFY